MTWSRSLRGRLVWSALIVLLALPALARADEARVHGRVELSMPGLSLEQVGPVVIFLERLDAEPSDAETAPATVAQINARFEPSFLIVERGQPVEMPNQDSIYHNVFSFSRPNDFDLGLYPAGASRRVVFEHPGVVKAYCSIHENMNATIFVAPGKHVMLLGADGAFDFAGVAPGRYRLATWCERLPGTSREITIDGASDLELEIQLVDLGA